MMMMMMSWLQTEATDNKKGKQEVNKEASTACNTTATTTSIVTDGGGETTTTTAENGHRHWSSVHENGNEKDRVPSSSSVTLSILKFKSQISAGAKKIVSFFLATPPHSFDGKVVVLGSLHCRQSLFQ